MKGALVSLLIFVVVALLLVTPWHQVATTQRATVTFSQIFSQILPVGVQVSSISEQGQTVYSLASPITIQGAQNVKPGSWTSSAFNLEIGSSLFVNFTGHGAVAIREDFSPFAAVDFTFNGEPPTEGAVTIPESGPYHIVVQNFAATPITVTSITVIEETPVTFSSGETSYYTAYNTGFSTVATTETGLTGVAPYSTLGPLPSGIILVVIGGVVVLTILIERSMISVSVRGRKRKRRRHK